MNNQGSSKEAVFTRSSVKRSTSFFFYILFTYHSFLSSQIRNIMQKSKNAFIQIGSLFLIQWLSIAVIVLNASALNASKDSNQGLIMSSETGPQDFIMLIMSATSLFCVSLLLCLYLQLFFRLMGNKPFSLSKSVLYVEVAFSFIIISFWTAATVIVSKHFNGSY